MLVILWLGVVAELIFFPALLAGPLGSVFKPRKKKAGEQTPDQSHSAAGPQLVVVGHEELLHEDATAAETESRIDEGSAVPPPHQPAGKPGTIRSMRSDRSHREP